MSQSKRVICSYKGCRPRSLESQFSARKKKRSRFYVPKDTKRPYYCSIECACYDGNFSVRQRKTMNLNVYIPTEEGKKVLHIKEGSGIVGTPKGSGVLIYFEGDIYGTGMDYNEKVNRAASRMAESYPTVAKAFVPASYLKQIGSWKSGAESAKDPSFLRESRLEVLDDKSLKEWTDGPPEFTGP